MANPVSNTQDAIPTMSDQGWPLSLTKTKTRAASLGQCPTSFRKTGFALENPMDLAQHE